MMDSFDELSTRARHPPAQRLSTGELVYVLLSAPVLLTVRLRLDRPHRGGAGAVAAIS
ncbi:MAG: hypothetical protein ACLP22_03340 [Solirubrobacteraceae bacterium]